jgi:hypothetical protein
LPLNGKTPGELSDLYPNLFVPAGLTFSIWGIIYTLLTVWIITQIIGTFTPSIKTWTSPAVLAIDTLFVGTCAFNALWLIAWHYQRLPLSLVVMFFLLFRLIRLNLSIKNGWGIANSFEKGIVFPAFGLYQGWITIAFIANVTTVLVAYQWSGWGIAATSWASVMIVVGSALAAWMVAKKRNFFHGVAVIWALLGIYLKRNGLGDAPLVANFALAGIVLISGSLLWTLLKKRF